MAVADKLCKHFDLSWKKDGECQGMVAMTTFEEGHLIVLLKPRLFMNINGRSVVKTGKLLWNWFIRELISKVIHVYHNMNFDITMCYFRHGSTISAQYQRPSKMAEFCLKYQHMNSLFPFKNKVKSLSWKKYGQNWQNVLWIPRIVVLIHKMVQSQHTDSFDSDSDEYCANTSIGKVILQGFSCMKTSQNSNILRDWQWLIDIAIWWLSQFLFFFFATIYDMKNMVISHTYHSVCEL